MKMAIFIRSLSVLLVDDLYVGRIWPEVEGLLRCRLVLLEVFSMLTTRIRNSNKFIYGYADV